MTELNINRTKLMLYTDIDQLPAERFSKINKFWMLSDELGNSFEDIDKIHMSRLLLAITDPDKLKKIIDNMRVLIYNIINEVNPANLAFAALIHSIDSKEITDLSDENLKRVITELSKKGLTAEILKKKIKRSGKAFTMN